MSKRSSSSVIALKPLPPCEAVLSEPFFLLRSTEKGSRALRGMLADDSVELVSLTPEPRALMSLMTRYTSVPMSFADACLVRLSELIPRAVVATLDSDFRVYRRNGRQVIPLLMPQPGLRRSQLPR